MVTADLEMSLKTCGTNSPSHSSRVMKKASHEELEPCSQVTATLPPPEPESHGTDLHHMGAKLRAHWLGLLGFGAVIMCIVFAGLMLRYGFSTSYEGRSNQLRLRYKLMRRGDQ